MSDKTIEVSDADASLAIVEACAVKGMPKLLDRGIIKAGQNYIRGSLVQIDQAIHSNAVQCLLHAQKHGDTSLMRRLLVDIVDKGTGYRRQGIIAWMRTFSPMELSDANGGVIKLTGTRNGEPIPWDVEGANSTEFWKLKAADEMVEWKPVFKVGIVGRVQKAIKDYHAALENTKIEHGKVVGPIDPKKPYYSGIHLDKMDSIFDRLEAISTEFDTFADDTAQRAAAQKQVAEGQTLVEALDKKIEQEAAMKPVDLPEAQLAEKPEKVN